MPIPGWWPQHRYLLALLASIGGEQQNGYAPYYLTRVIARRMPAGVDPETWVRGHEAAIRRADDYHEAQVAQHRAVLVAWLRAHGGAP